jgi:threonine/homoserine/homoserine lactone efflux protein
MSCNGFYYSNFFAIAAFIFGISPGPGTLAALSISTTRGLRSGLILSAGEAVGDVTYLTLAILSLGYLAQILEPIEPAMIVVRWLGAGYLIYLGISQFRLASLNINSNTPSSKNLIRLFFMGFLIGGTNPKVILFYLSFIPLFIRLI